MPRGRARKTSILSVTDMLYCSFRSYSCLVIVCVHFSLMHSIPPKNCSRISTPTSPRTSIVPETGVPGTWSATILSSPAKQTRRLDQAQHKMSNCYLASAA
ncbi:hypothetical protein PLICRDRAFT_95628 [Plicaturopsis crispa FD-325 SS-3]|uniref:Uncharacterized protein n=1 Tax=Plicaturopsis crispa FD-325 SS-3 TaxID=944288 RepID=A0A0C9SWU7_PLICR|nr:hypothetical protein PLICRDRAFT_95628 [Plicaturopsis crispa FD-325 SS-3]